MLARAAAAGLARVYPVGCISKGQKGEELAEYGELKNAGCVALSDDGRPVMSSALMRRALEYARAFELPVTVHEEDLGLVGKGVMHEGPAATRLGLKGIPTPRRRSWSCATSRSPSSPAAASTSRTCPAPAACARCAKPSGAACA